MNHRSRTGIALILVGLVLLLPAAVRAGEPDEANGHGDERYENVPGQGPSMREEHGWRVRLSDGTEVLTHGFDVLPDLPNPIFATPATAENITCMGGGQERFHAIVARAFDDRDRTGTLVPLMAQAVYEASRFVDSEAKERQPDAVAELKLQCAPDGAAAVSVATLPTSMNADSFSSVAGDLRRLGFNDRRTKYLIFYDDCVATSQTPCHSGGTANMYYDDRLTNGNRANKGPSYAIDWGSTNDQNPQWQTVLHEAGHTMGTVQITAPNSSGAAHCNDGQDIMCYADGGRASKYDPAVCSTLQFDCNDDDYFNVAPAPGSYLATHWNLANPVNLFIAH